MREQNKKKKKNNGKKNNKKIKKTYLISTHLIFYIEKQT